ncbi:hypothetical protein DPEC_G00204260 [Dallia pectoralis]|uniref:Uncharacterized protein n=1 Tax=Dallia pectoralis TaxID=75939 RepID=A0ACC2G9R7_DALPE|nr:hypothetical protein DPEC_G00204260 [Dallia pectoralis]
MLSKRITANSLELNPANQARNRMVKDSKDCQPAGCASPPDRPPLPAPPPAPLPAPPPVVLGRPVPCIEPPVFALCLPSVPEWCSAIFGELCSVSGFEGAPSCPPSLLLTPVPIL